MTQKVEIICPHCDRLMGVVDFDRPDYLEQENRIFFKGLGRHNPDAHEPDCWVLCEHAQSFTPITRAQVEGLA